MLPDENPYASPTATGQGEDQPRQELEKRRRVYGITSRVAWIGNLLFVLWLFSSTAISRSRSSPRSAVEVIFGIVFLALVLWMLVMNFACTLLGLRLWLRRAVRGPGIALNAIWFLLVLGLVLAMLFG